MNLLRKILLTGAFLLVLGNIMIAQDETVIYKDALKLYADNNYEKALVNFEKLIANGYFSFNLYYNAGNSSFKTGDIPGAILYYEKALLLKPFNEDARYNLEIARTLTVDNLEVIPELFFIRWVKMFSLIINTNSWALLSLISFTVFLLSLGIFLFSLKFKLKKISLLTAISCFFISILSLTFSITSRSLTARGKEAIVFEPVVTGKSSPGTGGADLFVIHEGCKVKIEDTIGEWYEIRLSDGTVGWISKDFVKRI